ncbi:MAG: hypothetical protein IH876_10385, partial [Gemmatimonadetes bacterium]|nr:hypothetical protein [Gemmatimonadota bacterium]
YRLDKVRAVRDWVPKVYMNGLDPRLSQILEPMRHSVDDENVAAQLDGFAQRYQRDLVVSRGQSLQASIVRTLVDLHEGGKLLTPGNVAGEINRENEGQDNISGKKVGAIIRDDLRLDTRKRKGRFNVIWDQGRIDELMNYYGLHDEEEEEAPGPTQEAML